MKDRTIIHLSLIRSTVNIFEFVNRNFRALPIISLFANIRICEVEVEIRQIHWKHKRTFPAILIREIINSRHSDLAKYRENITLRIISTFRVHNVIRNIYFAECYKKSYFEKRVYTCDAGYCFKEQRCAATSRWNYWLFAESCWSHKLLFG